MYRFPLTIPCVLLFTLVGVVLFTFGLDNIPGKITFCVLAGLVSGLVGYLEYAYRYARELADLRDREIEVAEMNIHILSRALERRPNEL